MNRDCGTHFPRLPPANAEGNRPAVAFARASLARKVILAQRGARMTQKELADRAGVRLETVNRIERTKHTADPATVAKLERVLAKAAKRG